ncbi:uncharacterized protein LY79DRAFT_528573 [Colletotrichum navitas]|uniref:CFEM domain-containing protein n=1 Tax=Colletotrichum navitas TaxID=681940 RepID=A0AAD8PLH3_9PEZI|nr:uncharacterized protein LY79DRAFT_528573 [Colletotrichum navitas]KAK1569484.1 hypothetical protein LY79DRAFT_528573 [Colletotrichum navitas]
MKYSFALASLIAVAAAQSGSSPIPECAQKCLADATASATSCKAGDYACTCEPANKAAISSAATSCVIAACGVDTALNQVLPASDKLCADAAAGGGAAASSAPAAASSAAAATSAAASSAAASSAAASSAAASSAVAATTSHAAATPTASANATAPTTPVQAGAAGIAPVGGLAMLILGALAI